MKKPDFDYYRMVVSTQHDPDILQSELKDLIKECVAYIETAPVPEVPCSALLSVIYDELEWLNCEIAALGQNPDNYIPGDKPDLTSRQDELQDILKKCNLPLNR